MKRPRLRLSTLLWLVAVVAAFLGGMRYGEYRLGPRWKVVHINNSNPPGSAIYFKLEPSKK